jgi:hypothetical protein
MAELWIARVHVERAPVLEPERHPPVVGRRHLRGPAIDEAERAIVAGSADAVADAELDALGPVDLGAAPVFADLGGLPEHQAVLAAVEQHGAAPVVDTDDTPLVARLDAEPPVGAVEGDGVARRIVPRERRDSSPPRAPPSRVAPVGTRELRRFMAHCELHRPTPESWSG